MKNISRLLVPFLPLLLLVPACKDKCDNADFGIQKLQPAANPVGYEVFIAATGVSADTRVNFDNVEAASVRLAEGGLIAEVPAGIAGAVSLSIQEGGCSDSRSFDVLGAYPGDAPVSPTSIVIPQPPASVPTSISNFYVNMFDADHRMILADFDEPGVISNSTELHNSDAYFDGNPISGTYSKTSNSILLIIDRSTKPSGYRDTLTGAFISNLPQQPNATGTILLTSKRSGRQVAFFLN